MIVYLTTIRYVYPMGDYLRTWGREYRDRITIVCYENFRFRKTWPRATYIFSDLERLTPAQAQTVSDLFNQLSAAGCRVLNDPSRTLRRFDLLRTLHDRGINSFNVYRMSARPGPGVVRFPVFLRRENTHDGSLTELFHTDADVDRALKSPAVARYDRRELMLVEYVHTADATGLFRKYAMMAVGGTLIPRHVLFSQDWVNKTPDLTTPQTQAEEDELFRAAPHANALQNVFKLAGVDYGRIDYSLADGKIQVWEINTNPVVMPLPGAIHPLRLTTQTRSAQHINDALRALDTPPNHAPVPVTLDPTILRAGGLHLRQRLLAPLGGLSRRFPNAANLIRRPNYAATH